MVTMINVGGGRHCGRQGQQGGENQGGRWHWDVSFRLEFSSTRIWYAMVMVVDMKVGYTLNMSDHIKYIELVVDDTVDGQDNKMEETMEVGGIMIYQFS